MVGLAGMLLGIALARLAGSREVWIRAAVLAQTADLVTFAVMWDHGEGELNPLGRLAMQVSHALVGEDSSIARLVGAVLMVSLKVGLIGYLIGASPYLGRYRRIVLAVAIAVGGIGTISNVVAYPNSSLPLLVVAIFALVAIRWPTRFAETVGLGVRLTLASILALGALAAFAYVPFADEPYLCAAAVCSPTLAPLRNTLAIAFVAASLVMLWITLRYPVRFVPSRFVEAMPKTS